MNQLPAHLQNRKNRRQVATNVHDGLGMGSMPSVSIKGNQFTLVDSSGSEKPIETKHLDCIIVDTNPGVSRTFWGLDQQGQPMAYSEQNFGPPVCFSDNGIGASSKATDPQNVSCRACPMSQFNWPSKIDPSKRTSACRPTKKIAVLAFTKGATGQDGVYRGDSIEFPFAMRIPITSHENLRTYSNKFINQPFDVSDVVTRIKFVHGQVGQLDFEAVGFIDEELDEEINEITDKKATDNLVGRGDVPIQGTLPAPEARPLAPRPAPAAATQPLASPAPAAATPFGNAAPASPVEPKKRVRRTKAEMEAAALANVAKVGDQVQPNAPFVAPQQPAAPVAPFARQPNGPVSTNHGIVSNAPEPTAEMEKTLDSLFKLPT